PRPRTRSFCVTGALSTAGTPRSFALPSRHDGHLLVGSANNLVPFKVNPVRPAVCDKREQFGSPNRSGCLLRQRPGDQVEDVPIFARQPIYMLGVTGDIVAREKFRRAVFSRTRSNAPALPQPRVVTPGLGHLDIVYDEISNGFACIAPVTAEVPANQV